MSDKDFMMWKRWYEESEGRDSFDNSVLQINKYLESEYEGDDGSDNDYDGDKDEDGDNDEDDDEDDDHIIINTNDYDIQR